MGDLALRTERQIARMSKIKNSGLGQYGAGPLEQQQFGTAGVQGVKYSKSEWGKAFELPGELTALPQTP